MSDKEGPYLIFIYNDNERFVPDLPIAADSKMTRALVSSSHFIRNPPDRFSYGANISVKCTVRMVDEKSYNSSIYMSSLITMQANEMGLVLVLDSCCKSENSEKKEVVSLTI